MSGPFKMKGHTLPGINQRSEVKNLADGRSASSPFQKKWEDMTDAEKISYAKKQKSDAEKVNKVNKVKVITTFNRDGSYTKTDGTTPSTYKPSDPHNPSEYTNEKGNKEYITMGPIKKQTDGKYVKRNLKKAARLTKKAEKQEKKADETRKNEDGLLYVFQPTGKRARKRAGKAQAKADAGSRKAYRKSKKQ